MINKNKLKYKGNNLWDNLYNCNTLKFLIIMVSFEDTVKIYMKEYQKSGNPIEFGSSEYFALRGRIASMWQDEDEAIRSYSAAIKIDPTNSRLYISRAKSKAFLGYIDSANSDIEMAIRLEPGKLLDYSDFRSWMLSYVPQKKCFNSRNLCSNEESDVTYLMHLDEQILNEEMEFALNEFN